MFRRCLTLCLLLWGGPALAADCSFVADTSLCGLPLDAGQARFDAVLGLPDGSLQLGAQRLGVFYGGHLLIVFEADRAVQVHSWARSEPAFLSQLGTPDRTPLRLTLGHFNPWSRSRQQVDLALENRPLLSADATVQTRALGRSRLTLRYRAPEAAVAGNPAQYRIDSLQLDLDP